MTTLEALERRIAALEQEVEGEKVVTRYILDQTRRNGDDLAALRARVDRLEQKVDALAADMAALKVDVAGLKNEMAQLRADLPGIVADSLREVLREERRQG